MILAIEKIETKKVSHIIEEKLEEMILDGQYQIGEKLPSVRMLCESFGVGRSAIRDAITALKGKGLVEVKQGEGTYVKAFDVHTLLGSKYWNLYEKDIQELFQARKIVEVGLAELAANHRSEKDVEDLHYILTAKKGWESDFLFHQKLACIGGNTVLMQFIDFISAPLKQTLVKFHQYIQNSTEKGSIIEAQHRNIFQAIKERNSKKASEEMLVHLTTVEDMLQETSTME